jgi:dedicator of cytokinesis protein 3
VNGGTDKYKQAFFNDSYVANNPSHAHLIISLKEQLVLQIKVLEDGMTVHKRRCDEKMMAFHVVIEEKFNQMREETKVFIT